MRLKIATFKQRQEIILHRYCLEMGQLPICYMASDLYHDVRVKTVNPLTAENR